LSTHRSGFGSFCINEALGREIEKSEPNTTLTKDYFECVKSVFGKSFSSSSERIGSRAFITIRFMPLSASDSMPILTEDPKVDNATDVSAPKKGQKLDFTNVINGVPQDPKEPVTVTIQTDKGPFYASSGAPTPTPAPTPQPTPIIIKQLVTQQCNAEHAKCDKIWTISAPGSGQLTIKLTSRSSTVPLRVHYLINGTERITRDFGFTKPNGQTAKGQVTNEVDLGQVKKEDKIGLQAELLPGGTVNAEVLSRWSGDLLLSINQ
jgi:hypothetical protein